MKHILLTDHNNHTTVNVPLPVVHSALTEASHYYTGEPFAAFKTIIAWLPVTTGISVFKDNIEIYLGHNDDKTPVMMNTDVCTPLCEQISNWHKQGYNNKNTFDIVLIEKEISDGLSRAEIIAICDLIKGNSMYPIEIDSSAETSSAMGFITSDAADSLDYDYASSGLNDFVGNILGDMDNETANGTYSFKNLSLKITRNIFSA